MTGLERLLGAKLASKSCDVNTAEALAGKGAVALYFSAHWCPPCRGFTPKFGEWYTESLKDKGLEVVFVSSDRDEDAFKSYHGEMPWLALPFADRDGKERLSKMFKVQGIPSIVILDADGQVITKDGRAAISNDPKGEEFPWKPKTLSEIMAGAKLVGKGGESLSFQNHLANKVYAIYFSAHWCPPCRGFTPMLAEWYTKDLKAKGLEVLFVSSDREESQFNEYYGEMPWIALDYADRKRKEQLSALFGVQGIPTCVILDKDGSTITKDGKEAISGDPTGAEFPWYPKPVKLLKNGPGNIQEVPTVIAFCETLDAAAQKQVVEAMTPIAKRYIDQAKTEGEDDPKVAFIIATEAGGLAGKIRGMFSMPSLPPGKHEHPLEKKDHQGGWGCDGCGGGGGPPVERYRCTQGCDFDYCGDCNAKANSGVTESQPPKLMLVDISDNGGFYEGPEGDITAETVDKMVADFLAKGLERKQLG